nr:reverse transcriptase domain-containing protein [Tanacetum cinerariifolium]
MADRTMEELLQAPTEGYGKAIVIPEILAENFEIKTNLLQFEETFGEAWERFKEMLRARPHHGFSELTQVDTFYNGLNEQDQDSLNAAAGGNLLSKTTREALKIIENKSKVYYSRRKSNVSRLNTNSRDSSSKTDDRIDKLADQILNLVEIVNKQVITPATAKAVDKTRVICEGAHAYYDCIATDSNQPSVCAASGSLGIPNELSSDMKSNEVMIKFMQNQINVLRGDFNKQEENLRRNLNNDIRSILGSFFQNQASTSGTLSSNIVPNPKGEMKAVTTRSGLAYEGPSIPTNSPLEKVVERDTKEITDKEHSNCQGSIAQVQPPVVPISILEPDVLKTQPKPNIPYPSRLNDQKLRKKATNQMEKFFQIFHDLHFDISFADALLLIPKFASTIKSLLTNKDKFFELAKVPLNENCSAMLLKKLPEKLGDPDKFLIPCDFLGIDVCHALADLDFEADPRVPLIFKRSFLRTGRALIDVYGEEITLKYNSKSSNPTLVSNPSFSEETDSEFCKEPIVKSFSPTLTPFGESDFFLEEIKDFLNDASIPTGIENSFYDLEGDILYLEKLLNDDPFQLPPMDLKEAKETKAKSLIEEPPKLELKEKLNDVTRKYHFPLPFMDQMLERLAGNEFYCFLDGFSGYFQILIDPQDQEKTTFICPYETFTYLRMPFGLCNAPDTFQRCMIAIFHDMIEKTMEVFMDYFSVFWDIFSSCLTNLDKMLKHCEDTNLVLNWEKCHFMYKEGIVLGHKISKSRIEVDRAKVDVIAKLPHPTTVKGVRSFLGHAGFYRCFIQDFSKIARPMTHLLEKDTPFVFSKECVDAFDTLKKKLTEASILVVPDWNLPFELMCDARNFAIGVVSGQLSQPNGPNFKVNGHRVKHYFEGDIPSKVVKEKSWHLSGCRLSIHIVVSDLEFAGFAGNLRSILKGLCCSFLEEAGGRFLFCVLDYRQQSLGGQVLGRQGQLCIDFKGFLSSSIVWVCDNEMTKAKFDIKKCDGISDFGLWKIKMRTLLIQHECEAALEVLPKDMEAEAKPELNKKAHNVMILCLVNKVQREVTGEMTTVEVWSKLEDLYMTKSLANRLYMKKKLYTFYMPLGRKISEHIDESNKIILDLENIKVKFEDEYLAFLLLTSLPASYKHFMDTYLYGREALTLKDMVGTLNSTEIKKRSNAKGDNGEGLYVSGRTRGFVLVKWKVKIEVLSVLLRNNMECRIRGIGKEGMGLYSQVQTRGIWNSKSRSTEEEDTHEPLTYQEAVACKESSKSKASMKEEMHSIKEGIEGVQKPRYKARLVACGFTQRIGIDYNKVFSPVVRHTSIRVIFALIACRDYELEQVDVKTVFLHGILEEMIYMRQPSGYEQGSKLCLLNKSLYGLKQSLRQWYKMFDEYMLNNGLKSRSYDNCVYFRSDAPGDYIYLLLYVDDMLISCKIKADIGSTNSLLKMEFNMKELEEAKKILGMDIVRDYSRKILRVSQSGYVSKVLNNFKVDNEKSVKIPLDGHFKLLLKDFSVRNYDVERMIKLPYENAVGRLMYLLVCTRPDIAYTIGQSLVTHFSTRMCCKLEGNATTRGVTFNYRGGVYGLYEAVKKAIWLRSPILYRNKMLALISYPIIIGFKFIGGIKMATVEVIGTLDLGLHLYVSSTTSLVGYTDADWAGCPSTCSAEAEYRGVANVVAETAWLRNLLCELHSPFSTATLVYCDNGSAVYMSANHVQHQRTEHIEIDIHFVRDMVTAG